MSDAGGTELQFERAEYVAPAGHTCSGCHVAIRTQYFAVNGKTICSGCHASLQALLARGTPASRFFAALGWGGAGALAGAVLYYAIRAVTGYELGLVAIVVGILVGKGVARGAHGRGGGGYQLMAVVLTYFAIALTYVPEIWQAWSQHAPATNPIAQVITGSLMIALLLFSPIVVGIKAPLSLVISGIALYEAWKMTRRAPLAITGPYVVAQASPPAASGASG
jgi:hypothetical protein